MAVFFVAWCFQWFMLLDIKEWFLLVLETNLILLFFSGKYHAIGDVCSQPLLVPQMRNKLASVFFDRGVLPNLSYSLGSDFWAGRSPEMRGINLKGAHEAAQALDLF